MNHPAPSLFLLLTAAILAAPAAAEPDESALPATVATPKVDLLPAPTAGRLDRVTVELEVGGHLLQPRDPADRTSPTTEEPMSVRGELEYDERRLTDARSARRYRRAEATLETGGRTKSPRLPDDRRLIVADDQQHRVVLSAAGGPLTRDQLDLIDVMGATLGVDALLPTKPVAVGGGGTSEWKVDGPAMGKLLGLDQVGMADVTATIDDTNTRYARFQMAGVVHGTVDGAATEIDLRGIGLFSLEKRRLTQLNLAIREDRKVGPATPGFKGVAKARIKIKPLDPASGEAPELADASIAGLDKRPASTPITAVADRQGFRVEHDRRWFAAGGDRRSLVLRRVEGVDLAAQATFTVSSASGEPSLEGFESQVRASIGDALQSIDKSEQWTNRAGCRCLGVVARGAVDGVPVEWRYYQAAGEPNTANAAERVTLAATIEPTADPAAAEAARGLIDSLVIMPKRRSTASRRVKRRSR